MHIIITSTLELFSVSINKPSIYNYNTAAGWRQIIVGVTLAAIGIVNFSAVGPTGWRFVYTSWQLGQRSSELNMFNFDDRWSNCQNHVYTLWLLGQPVGAIGWTDDHIV